MTENPLDKYILLFSFVKLAILQGKTVVMCNDIIEAYRIKLFLNKFSLKAFCLAPDMPKNQIGSIIHFFHIGQFDIIIMLHAGYSQRPILKDVQNIVNFDIPATYNSYKESAQLISEENGAVLTLYSPADEKQRETMEHLQKKVLKNYHREDFFKCVPVMWHELNRLKSRVQSVIDTLNNKNVQREKMIEFKKALVSNKSLKAYFEENPEEKEILVNDIAKIKKHSDKNLFKSLAVMPDYVIPENIMAINDEQLSQCTLGVNSVIHGRTNHTKSLSRFQLTMVEPDADC